MLIHWHIAQATKQAMKPTIIALNFVHDFWTTWAQVYRAPGWMDAE